MLKIKHLFLNPAIVWEKIPGNRRNVYEPRQSLTATKNGWNVLNLKLRTKQNTVFSYQ